MGTDDIKNTAEDVKGNIKEGAGKLTGDKSLENEGKVDQAKGKLKQEIGKATGDPNLHDEGVADEAAGEVQEGFGTVKRKVGEAVKDLGDRIKR
jgi:uncharacterized protein YjbJ (UPF0337 family)